jgi:hypothetical protein
MRAFRIRIGLMFCQWCIECFWLRSQDCEIDCQLMIRLFGGFLKETETRLFKQWRAKTASLIFFHVHVTAPLSKIYQSR